MYSSWVSAEPTILPVLQDTTERRPSGIEERTNLTVGVGIGIARTVRGGTGVEAEIN